MKLTAQTIETTWTVWDSAPTLKMAKKFLTISLVQASRTRDIMVAMAPPTIKGLLFPQGERHLSLLMPT